jgi:hypothetical protein
MHKNTNIQIPVVVEGDGLMRVPKKARINIESSVTAAYNFTVSSQT